MSVTPVEITETRGKPRKLVERRSAPRTRGRVPLNIVLALLVIYFLVPFWWLIVNSSKTAAGLFGGDSALWFSDDINYVGNFVDLFTYGGGIYARWLANSAIYAILGGLGATVLAVLAGYGFAKYRFAGRRAAFAILLGAVMVPTTALVIPTFVLFALESGLMLGLWSRHTVQPAAMVPGGGAELAFPVNRDADVDATCADWKARGLSIIQEPTVMDFGRTFVALDPDNHRLRVFAPAAG